MTMAVTTSPGLMARLKDATAELHRHAETRALQKSLLAAAISTADFRSYLIELHAIHEALENALTTWRARRPELANVFDDRQRRAADLAADISALAARAGLKSDTSDGATNARCDLVRFIDEQTTFGFMPLLGCLYVLEGSMNGNKFIARALARAWQTHERDGLRYLDPYGSEQQQMWQRFRAAMDALEASEDDINSAVEAACLTFQSIAMISDEVLRGCERPLQSNEAVS
jgi:heme oxygenase